MTEPRFRSRTYRRISKKLPGGSAVIQHEKRKPKVAKCAQCGKELRGIPREKPIKMKSLGISKKRVERPFGGHLCSACSRNIIKKEARV